MFCAGCLFIVVLVCFLPAGSRLGLQHSFKMVRHNEAAFHSDVLLRDGIYENSQLLVLLNPLYCYQANLTKKIVPRQNALGKLL
ncbi:hypothetical protein ES703_58300 [subsurface metagenome]